MEKENGKIIINPGTLKSLSGLYYSIAPKLDKIRDYQNENKKPDIYWDLRNLEAKKINISAITSFLSITKSISDYFNKPFPLILNWDPYILNFLKSIGFFNNSDTYGIFSYNSDLLNSLTNIRFNPNTKIIHGSEMTTEEIPAKIFHSDSIAQREIKESLRDDLLEAFILSFGGVFLNKYFSDEDNENLLYLISNFTSELILNSIIHGKYFPFVGGQGSSKGITITVCDNGLGFLNSITNTNPWLSKFNLTSEIEAMFYASLLKDDDISLKTLIEEILNVGGYVIISSMNSELRWEKENWKTSKYSVSKEGFNSKLSIKNILGDPLQNFVPKEEIKRGYYKIFDNTLKGVRITFELPFKK